MAAGDISQELLSIVLSELPDDIKKLSKSTDIIYSKLLRHEKRLAEELLVNRKVLTFTVPAGIDSEVDLDDADGTPLPKVYRVIGIVNGDDVLHDVYRLDSFQRKIIFSAPESQASYSVKLFCACGLTGTHVINSANDPEIRSEYHYFLADYVINDYMEATKTLLGYYSGKSKQQIDQEVLTKTEILWDVDKISSFLSLNQMYF